MRLPCLSAVSLLAVVFSTLSGGDCALPKPVGRRHEARQDGPHSFGDEEPVSKLNRPPYAGGTEQGAEGMPGGPDVMELDGATIQGMEGPEVLRMDRNTFNRFDVERKVELTEGLSAKEWNEVLENFWVEGEDNAYILYYTLKYDEERRLKMLRGALTENLQHLFATMSDLAYVPHTSKVIQLLERGLEVYPCLRHLILSTIYQLGYPVAEWHFDNSEEDMDLLKYLITMGWVKRETIVGHLTKIVTLYPLEILDLLLTKTILTKNDVCTLELYRKVCGLGGKEYLKWAKDSCELRPDQGSLDAAVSGGHEDVIEFIARELGMEMVPSQEAVNEAATNGMLALLTKKCSVWGLFPNIHGANGAAMKGQLDLLKWLATLKPEAQRVYPNQYGANRAAGNGHTEVLEWLATLEVGERRVYPEQDGANFAAANGNLETLEWLATLKVEERRVYPNQYGADWAAAGGHLKVLEWLATLEVKERRVYPNQDSANYAAMNGHLDVLKWLAAERQVYPDRNSANYAAMNGHLDVLKWLAAERQVYPDQNGANWAAENGHLEVLERLATLEPKERRVYPSRDGANAAARNGHLEVLEWLVTLEPNERRVYPSYNDAIKAAGNGQVEVLEWLVTLEPEERRVYPGQDNANEAAENGQLNVLNWLAERAVYPDQDGANDAAAHGRLEVLEWLATLEAEERRVYPNQNGADRAAMNGHLDVLKWLARLEPEERRVYPLPYSINYAAKNGHLQVLEWSKGQRLIIN